MTMSVCGDSIRHTSPIVCRYLHLHVVSISLCGTVLKLSLGKSPVRTDTLKIFVAFTQFYLASRVEAAISTS
jgi:hypothetical protein